MKLTLNLDIEDLHEQYRQEYSRLQEEKQRQIKEQEEIRKRKVNQGCSFDDSCD